MDTKLIVTDKNLQTNSFNILLKCLKIYHNIPPISFQESTYIDNQSIQHQCILRFNYENNNIETVWEKIKVHIPYIKKADLQIKDKYNGSIHKYIQYKKNNDSLSDLPPYFLT